MRLAIATALFLAAARSFALAAPNDDQAKMREAQRLFQEGQRAHERQQYVEARDRLQRSLSLYPHPATAYNLAVTLRGLGETSAAVDLLDALERGRYGQLDAEKSRTVKEQLEGARRELATLTLDLRGAESAEVTIDGKQPRRLLAGEPLTVNVDAGERTIEARAPGRKPAALRTTVARGGSAQLQIALVVDAAPLPALDLSSRPPPPPIYKRGWFWVAAAALAAGTAAAMVVIAPFTKEPTGGGVFMPTYTLGYRE